MISVNITDIIVSLACSTMFHTVRSAKYALAKEVDGDYSGKDNA